MNWLSGDLPPSIILGALRRFDAEFRPGRNEAAVTLPLGASRVGAVLGLGFLSELGIRRSPPRVPPNAC